MVTKIRKWSEMRRGSPSAIINCLGALITLINRDYFDFDFDFDLFDF
jgi:hypothetical protein